MPPGLPLVYGQAGGLPCGDEALMRRANNMPIPSNQAIKDFIEIPVLWPIEVASITPPFGRRHTIPSEVPNLLRGLGSIQR